MAVVANILSMSARQDDGQNARREPVDNGDQIGKVLALRPYGCLCGRQKFRQLADWGANVIKIETPPGLEEPMGGPREGGDFQNLHRNKRSMTLNLKAPEGLAAFKRMVKKA